MNGHQTIEKMKTMRLQGMAQTHYQYLQDSLYQEYTLEQYTSLLIDQEWENRQNKKTANLLKNAKFRSMADCQNVDFTQNRGLDKNVFARLASLDFITQKQNILITGPTGTGKSYLTQALGRKACLCLYKTQYFSANQLFDQIKLAKLEGTYHKFISRLKTVKLLIIEDFGLIPLDELARQALMEIVEFKYENASMIFTSQIPVKKWHELIGEPTIADAIMDRIIHSSHRINLKGGSLRKNKIINL